MGSINLKFRASAVEGKEGTLYYCIIHKRMTHRISTDYHLFPNEWDKKKGCIKIPKCSERVALVKLIHSKVEWEMQQMLRIVHNKEAEGRDYTIHELADELSHIPPCQSVFSFIESLIAKKEKMQRIGTQNNYRHTYNRFREFQNYEDLTFSVINADMMVMFEAWLKNCDLQQNTIANYLRTFRTFYNKAIKEHLATDRHIFDNVHTSNTPTRKRALSVQDIQKIRNLQLPDGSPLAIARDIFMFSFYMRGMPFADMAYLKKTSLKNDMVSYNRRKTNQTINVGWVKQMQSIVDKYAHITKDSQYMLPILSGNGAGMDSYTKYKSAAQRINRNLKKIGGMIGLKMPLTSYVARHSWASIALHLGIPIGVISEGMGHNSIRTTQIYLESIDVATVDQANQKILKHLLG